MYLITDFLRLLEISSPKTLPEISQKMLFVSCLKVAFFLLFRLMQKICILCNEGDGINILRIFVQFCGITSVAK